MKAICVKKCIKVGPKLTKNLKIQIFKFFLKFLCTFRKSWWRRMLKTFKAEQISCRGGFEEINAVGVEKMHQIQTEIDERTEKKIKFSTVFCNFCALFEKLGGLEC